MGAVLFAEALDVDHDPGWGSAVVPNLFYEVRPVVSILSCQTHFAEPNYTPSQHGI
jgi:hypothetical protein